MTLRPQADVDQISAWRLAYLATSWLVVVASSAHPSSLTEALTKRQSEFRLEYAQQRPVHPPQRNQPTGSDPDPKFATSYM
jgi:hypothetical protein